MVLSAVTFNVLDGLRTTSGAFVFFMAIPTFVILLYQGLTWEPTESILNIP